MLRPSKHSHPDRTVISASMVLLTRLKDRRTEDYEGLRKLLQKRIRGADPLFVPALNLLFLLGIVEYRAKTDSFEYVGPNEAV